ncbi:cytochrome c oxidase subunit 2A [Thalassobacillus devorans]|nr:cytochrome c oxidase subunit 2A [Thalassobacillus devorans]
MAESNVKQNEEVVEESSTIKGTIFSVAVVGGVILVTYLLIYGLYMTRI